jgi:CheY-like chemotaxis protein
MLTMSILIVDDEIDFRESLGEILLDAGYSVIEASNAHEALEQIRKNDIRIMLIDYSMPGMSGEELLTHLETSGNRPPSLFLTALAPWQLVNMMKKGVGYIRKPINTYLLLGTLKSMLAEDSSHETEKVC